MTNVNTLVNPYTIKKPSLTKRESTFGVVSGSLYLENNIEVLVFTFNTLFPR